MEKRIHRLALLPTKYPRTILLIIFLLTAISLFFLPKIRFDTSVTAIIMEDHPEYKFFREWQQQFGTDEFIIVVFKDKQSIFRPGTLQLISDLTSKIEKMEYVRRVISLSNMVDIRTEGEDLIVNPFYREIPTTQIALKDLSKRALENPLFLKNIISPDGKTTSFLIEIEDIEGQDLYRKITVEKVKELFKNAGINPIHLSGNTVLSYSLGYYMQRDLTTFLPLILIFIFLIFYVMFRSFLVVILSMSAVLISLICTMAFLYLERGSINNFTTIIPPLIMTLSILNSIHLFSEYRKEYASSPAKVAISSTVKKVLAPCFFCTITDMVGFSSLSISKIPAMKDLGIVSAIGIGFAFIITFSLLPAVLTLYPVYNSRSTPKLLPTNKILIRIADFNAHHKGLILFSSILIILLSVFFATRIKVETNLMEFFKKKSPIYQDTLFMEKELSGVQILEISLKAKEKDTFKDPELLRRIERLQMFLTALPRVDKVTSLVDYLKRTNQAFHNSDPEYYCLPDSRPLVAQYLLLFNYEDLKPFIDTDYKWASIQVRSSEHSSVKTKILIEKIDKYLKQNFPDLENRITGHPTLEVVTIDTMVNSQISSLPMAMVIIFALMFTLFRSIPVGLISIAPNVFPIVVNFGLMGLLGISLNTSTATISAIAIGIVVDDSIHFLHAFGERIKFHGDYMKAMYETIGIKGEAILFTSVILFFGFGILVFSNFIPVIQFGFLTALIFFTGVLAELTISPVLLLVFKPRF
jgi:predicted RND superfamily exporter protein